MTCTRSYCHGIPKPGEKLCDEHLTLPTFVLGEDVRWYTRNRGVLRTKLGVVAFVVPSGVPFRLALDRWTKKQDHYLKLSNGKPRDHESYGILVQERGRPKPTLFWPRVQTLEKK